MNYFQVYQCRIIATSNYKREEEKISKTRQVAPLIIDPPSDSYITLYKEKRKFRNKKEKIHITHDMSHVTSGGGGGGAYS